ncbi:hypothetical protein APHAL10511_003811 [Amanita phalloides]|nr:hypothetical protein APHAL10511_003811 [Amanita phalloides]
MLDFQVQVWPENESYESNYGAMTRGRGGGYRGSRGSRGHVPSRTGTPSNPRGSGGPQVRPSTPSRGNGIFQARAGTPSRGGAPQYGGRGHAGLGSPNQSSKRQARSKLGIDSPLSSLLHETRPLLRPIVFVKSQLTPYLFQEEEELLQPAVEDTGDVEGSHIPTAERVAQVFNGSISIDVRSGDEEEIEEIDFNDTEKLLDVQAKPVKKYTMSSEEHFPGYNKPATHSSTPSTQPVVDAQHQTTAPSNVDVVEGIAEITIDSQPEITSQSVQEIAGEKMAVATQPTADTIESQDARSLPSETQVPEGPALQATTTNDSIESAAMVTLLPASLPAAPAASFFIDTVPSRISPSSQSRQETTTSQILGIPTVPDDDDDIIVYVAPHPRTGRSTPAIPTTNEPPTTLPSVSMLTGLPTISELAPSSNTKLATLSAASTSRFAEARKPRQFGSPLLLASPSTHRKAKARMLMQEARIARRRKGKGSMFSFAAERQEKEWQELEEPDPRWEERRRGDSDIDWGDEDKDHKNREDAAMKPASGADGMEVDPELLDERSRGALESFADGMLGQERSKFVTMDEIADVEKLNQEDEASDGGAEGSSDDESFDEEEQEMMNAVLAKEEEKLMGEAEDHEPSEDDEDDEDSEEEDESEDELDPRSSFQARLERLRAMKKRAETSGEVDMSYWMDYEDQDDDEDEFMNFTWAERDSIDQIQDIVDENESILTNRDRKATKKMFKAINNGDYVDLYSFTVARHKKDRPTDLPIELQEQWEKDRAKKAERKATRKLEKLKAAADPLAKKKGGKKGRKAMLAAARLDPEITSIGPNRIIDMTTLVQQIGRFLEDPSRQTMTLPPANKYCRKLTHEVAMAFGLQSYSKGHGDERYTTLTRTSRSGLFVDERKLGQILRRSPRGAIFAGGDENGKGKGKKGFLRQKEGEEVGKAAPKIDSSNVGFKMLEAMGWSAGDRIGVTGGLDQPLTAIIKHSKLGLGATRQ